MKTIAGFVCFFIFIATVRAQNNYRVTYKGGYKDHDMRCGTVFNDSLSYSYMYITKKDPTRNKAIIDKLDQGHAILYSKKYDCIFSPNYWLGKDYLLFDSIPYKNWIIGSQTKTIAGHECQSAYAINQHSDTAFIFYAKDMKFPYGPYTLGLAPGLILEALDQTQGLYWLAQTVEPTTTTPVFPKAVKFLSRKEYLDRK